MNPRHVLMTADSVGGVWQYALDLAGGLTAGGTTVTLAVLGPEPSTEQTRSAGEIAGCRIVSTRLPLDWMASSAAEVGGAGEELAALAGFVGADLVHLHSAALGAEARFPVPVVAVCHSCVATWWDAVETGPLPGNFAWQRDLVGAGLRAAAARVAPTRAFADATARTYGLEFSPVVVPNGRRMPAPRRQPAARPFVFTAGRLWDPAKNAATLDRVAARLSVPVLAAGATTGPNGAGIYLEVAHALGQLSDEAVRAQLDRRPVFVSLARYEPFGLAVLEAAQAGCALVLSDMPTFRELWDGAAVFVPADDDEGAAHAIEGLVADPARKRRMGDAARARSAAYSVDTMVDGIVGVHDAVLADRAGSSARRVAA